MNYSFGGKNGSVSFGAHYGGGILGNPVYILKTAGDLEKSDGAGEVPRTWARDVYKDLLCRDLPVVRPEDTEGFVRPNSPIAFRQSSACVACHVTIDRGASTIRHINYYLAGTSNTPPNVGSYYLDTNPPTYLQSPDGHPLKIRIFTGGLQTVTYTTDPSTVVLLTLQ